MFWNDRQRLDEIARGVRGFGWLLAILILVVGAVMAATGEGEMALFMRAIWAAAVLALASVVAWLIDRYAERAATR
jgi:uncharacterized membrane protein YoaK (UPF0700 family)